MASEGTPATLDGVSTLHEIDGANGVLRYHDIGEGPPVVLLHGSGPGVTGWRNFGGVAEALGEHFRCLILEFPGFGVSDPGDGHPIALADRAVLDLLDGLGLDRVDLIGNSMGGIVGARIAIDAPQRVRRLVSVGGIGKPVLSSGISEGIRALIEFTDDPTRERLIRWLSTMVYDQAMVTPELIEERWRLATEPETLAGARRMYGSAAFAANAAATRVAGAAPYWSQLDRIQAPTLLTWGRDDRVNPLDMALIAVHDIPKAELHVIPQCGHWAMIEAREAWLSSVIAFLTR